jgi:hypothetical protein
LLQHFIEQPLAQGKQLTDWDKVRWKIFRFLLEPRDTDRLLDFEHDRYLKRR